MARRDLEVVTRGVSAAEIPTLAWPGLVALALALAVLGTARATRPG